MKYDHRLRGTNTKETNCKLSRKQISNQLKDTSDIVNKTHRFVEFEKVRSFKKSITIPVIPVVKVPYKKRKRRRVTPLTKREITKNYRQRKANSEWRKNFTISQRVTLDRRKAKEQTYKQTNIKQTNQPSKQTNHDQQANKQAHQQANKQTSKQANKQTSKQDNLQTDLFSPKPRRRPQTKKSIGRILK
jgi:hypothetical protein